MEGTIEEWLDRSDFEPRLAQEIAQAGRKRRVKRDQIVMSQGEKAIEMPFVLSGLLRVVRHDRKGKEIFLYYLEGGDTCAMSLTCCMEGKPSEFS
ncbi:MAG: cyclic nucleotide-binding domain-containing protein, partial [Bacteroidota bacterium]